MLLIVKRSAVVFLLLINFNSYAITQVEFVELLKKNHPFFNTLNLNTKIKKIDKRLAATNEDWIIRLSAKRDRNYFNNAIISTDYTNNVNSVSASAVKKIIKTGGDFTIASTWVDSDISNHGVDNKISLDYNHPLMLNSGGINLSLGVDLAQINIQIDATEKLVKEQNFISNNLYKFFDLAYAQEQKIIILRRFSLAKKGLKNAKDKFKSSVIDKIDVILQEEAFHRAKQQLLQVQQDLILKRQELAVILGANEKKILAKADIYKKHLIKNVNLKQFLLVNSRALKIDGLVNKKIHRELLSNENKSQAKLDFNVGITKGIINAPVSGAKLDKNWHVGLNYSHPLGGKADDNTAKNKAQLELINQQKQEKLINLHAKAKVAKQKIELLSKIMQSNSVQIKIAKERTTEEKDRYVNGNTQLVVVIRAQDNEQSVQLDYARNAKNYQQAIIQYKVAIDKLL